MGKLIKHVWILLTSNKLRKQLFRVVAVGLYRYTKVKLGKTSPKISASTFLELGCIPFREMIRERRMGFLHYILNEDKKSLINRFFEAQVKNGNKNDWCKTVSEDLKYLDMEHLDFEMIRRMKKTSFMKEIKQSIQKKTLEKLQNDKESHSKVKEIEHNSIQMQKYLTPNHEKMRKEDAQLIFKLRCRVTEAKINMRGKYDNLECEACGLEDESQEHIIKCEVLNRNKEDENIQYERLLNGTVKEQMKIAYKFQENNEVLKSMKRGET